MRRCMIFTLLATFSIILIAGCSDDDCVDCPDTGTGPSLFAIGKIATNDDRLSIYIEIFDLNASASDIDSVLLDGQNYYCCVRELSHTAAEDGRQVIAEMAGEICPAGVYDPFTPADSTDLTMYTQGEAHNVRLPLLDVSTSMPGGLSISVHYESDQIQIDWSAIPEADWYSVRMKSFPMSGPSYLWTDATVDVTTATMDLPFGGSFTREVDIYVAAATGPMPTEEQTFHNVSGPHITGTIYSVSDYRHLNVVLHRSADTTTEAETPAPPRFIDMLKSTGHLP